MKRILICSVMMAVSMLFTGCNSMLANLDGGGYQEIKWDLVDGNNEWGSMGKDPAKLKDAPDYYDMNETEKFNGLKGNRAFQIYKDHSQDTSEMESFQIGTLLPDKTFIYAYTTRIAGDAEDRPLVHCVAAYQYDTGNFRTIHETQFIREEGKEDEESFYIQVCTNPGGEQNVFVYDNGSGYIYSASGRLLFEAEIESFVRTYFNKAYSLAVNNVMTDGNERIFVDLTLEKEPVELEVSEDSTSGPDEISEEEADKEAEQLETELDNKTLEVVLLYDFETIETTIDQENLALTAQAAAWKNMVEGQTLTEHPDAQADWNTAVANHPDQWGIAYLDQIELEMQDQMLLTLFGISNFSTEGIPVLTWTGERTFSYTNDGYICNFVPILKGAQYQGLTAPEENADLKDAFIVKNGVYRELVGTLGNWKRYDYETVSRSYTYKWYTTGLNEKGEEVQQEHTQDYTQTLYVESKRYASLSNAYTEGYMTLKDTGIETLLGQINNKLICSTGTKIMLLNENNKLEDIGLTFSAQEDLEAYIINCFEDGGKLYVSLTADAGIWILDKSWSQDSLAFFIPEMWLITPDILEIEEKKEQESTRVPTKKDQEYVDAYKDLEKDTMGSLANMIPSGNYHLDYLLHENLNSKYVGEEVNGEGFLMATSDKGLLFVNPNEETSLCLKEGSWYGNWRCGNKIVSVGFDKTAAYTAMDVAYARVLEYDSPTALYNQEVEAAAEEKKKQEESSAAAEVESTTAVETTSATLNQWKEQKELEEESGGSLNLDELRDSVNTEREKIEETTKGDNR